MAKAKTGKEFMTRRGFKYQIIRAASGKIVKFLKGDEPKQKTKVVKKSKKKVSKRKCR